MLKIFQKKYSDQEVIAAIQMGTADMDACISHLYSANRKPIFSYILNNQGSAGDAEEILQIGVCRLYEIILQGKFQSKSSLSSYLYAICRNTWINRRKKEARYSHLAVVDEGDEFPLASAPDPLHYLESNEMRSQITELLGALGDQCRKLLLWSDGESRTMQWITDKLGYSSVQSTMNRKSKCKRALKDKVRATPRHQQLLEEVLSKECLDRLKLN